GQQSLLAALPAHRRRLSMTRPGHRRRGSLAVGWLAVVAALAGCGPVAPTGGDPGLEGLAVERVDPPIAVPGTRLVVSGRSFVPAEWGTSRLRLRGRLSGGEAVDVALDASFVDYERLEVP